MKKIITICILIMNVFLAISQQQGNVSLKWTDKRQYSYGKNAYVIPQFEAENFQFDSYSKTVNYSLTIKLNSAYSDNSLRITNPVFESIAESELGVIAVKAIPTSYEYTFKANIARD